jgi:hypothetical protein
VKGSGKLLSATSASSSEPPLMSTMSDSASDDYEYDSILPAIVVKLQNFTVSCRGCGLMIEDHTVFTTCGRHTRFTAYGKKFGKRI